MKDERRSAPRVRVGLSTYIEGGDARHGGVIHNLSIRGCFVVTPREFPEGSLVRVEVGKPGVLRMTMKGVVVYRDAARGVGVRFTDLTVTKQAMLAKLLQNVSQEIAA
jgi:hypothetical protein